MAKKISFPNRPCPQCQQPIHIKSKKHEACGWGMNGSVQAPVVASKNGRKTKPGAKAVSGGITLADIEAVKMVVDKIGAEKVLQLTEVLA
jgi:hypothetical protein